MDPAGSRPVVPSSQGINLPLKWRAGIVKMHKAFMGLDDEVKDANEQVSFIKKEVDEMLSRGSDGFSKEGVDDGMKAMLANISQAAGKIDTRFDAAMKRVDKWRGVVKYDT